MTPLVSFVQTTTYDVTPPGVRLPPVIWSVFTALNKVHGLWRWYRKTELYSHPENLAHLLAGHVLNFVIGDSLILRVSAQCLLVATRILDCAKQQAGLCRSGHRWVEAITGKYPPAISVEWEKPGSDGWLSPSTVHWWKTTTQTISERITRIAYATLDIFKKIFKLSMSIMDVIDAFCWNPTTKDDAITESFINIKKWIATAVENKEELLDGLANNKALIERLLQNSPFTFEQLHTGVSKTLEKTEFLHGVSNAIGGETKKQLKRIGDGFMIGVGAARVRPTFLADT